MWASVVEDKVRKIKEKKRKEKKRKEKRNKGYYGLFILLDY
jgi:hypothetical protein